MWQRIRTAMVLLLIVGAAMFLGDVRIFVAWLFLTFAIACVEFARLIPVAPTITNTPNSNTSNHTPYYPYIFMLVVMTLAAGSLNYKDSWLVLWVGSVVLWAVLIYAVLRYPKTLFWYGARLNFVAALIIISTMSAMYFVWTISPYLLLYVFALVWCADSGAYFVGRKLGRRKMSPAVSPNKSIEGLIGGMVIGMMMATVVTYQFVSSNWWYSKNMVFVVFPSILGLSLLSIVLSVFGDLFESMLKRQAQVKDSGTILPGHGGVLDRIDSQLAAMPIFALGLWLLGFEVT